MRLFCKLPRTGSGAELKKMAAGKTPRPKEGVAVVLFQLQFLEFQEALKLADAGRMAHFAERLGFDLAYSLAGDPELPPNLLERAGETVTQPKTQFQDLPFAFRQAGKHVLQLVLQEAEAGEIQRALGGFVLDEVTETGFFAVARGGLE